ncbi:MAG: FecR domain-containing protein [Lentimonas sp.]
MKALRLPLLLIAFFVIGNCSLNAAQLATAKAVDIVGTVTKYNKDGNSPLVAGDILNQGDSISVTALSSAQLVFSNGSTIDLKENTSIDITELTQDSFGGNKSYEQLEADPSKSQALLELNYGELDGHVKKLQKGSKFVINTPLGTAAIRGTRFTIKLAYNKKRNEFSISVVNKDGVVMFQSDFDYDQSSVNKEKNSSRNKKGLKSIPKKQEINVRVHRNNPKFEAIFNRIRSRLPTEVRPPSDLPFVPTPEDPDIQIVSPNTPAGPV